MSGRCGWQKVLIEVDAGCPPDLSYSVPSGIGIRGVIVTDAANRIRSINPGICSLLDVSASDLLDRDAGEAVWAALKRRLHSPEEFRRRSERLYDNPGEIAEDVMEISSPEHRVLHRYSTPLLDENRQPIGRIEVYSDITKRRQLEDANKTLYKQIRAAHDELKSTQEQLVQSEKLRAVGEIAGGVAHDFNNTLGIILGNIHLLLRTAEDYKTRSRLQAIEQAALDATETVRRIREFTRAQPDDPLGCIDLSALVAGLVEVMSPSWEAVMHTRDRRVELELDLLSGVSAVGIAAEIREVLANILLNAVQSMPQGGKISISTGVAEDSAWVKISDTGAGMTEEVRRRVFDPFFTTKGVEGTGLGMSVAYGIVKRHNGRIHVESVPGLGAAVTVSLPAGSSVTGPEEKYVTAETTAVEPARILIVDDEVKFAEVFMEMLSECGHAVCVAGSGQEAMEHFMSEPFDLVFTDLGMPGMSGWQVAEAVKAIRPGIPVVLLTGWGDGVDESRLAKSKIDLVVSKPVKMCDIPDIVSQVRTSNRNDHILSQINS